MGLGPLVAGCEAGSGSFEEISGGGCAPGASRGGRRSQWHGCPALQPAGVRETCGAGAFARSELRGAEVGNLVLPVSVATRTGYLGLP